jgi:hypothetical protein
MTQQTAGQAQLDMRFPPAGTYKFKITAYKQPTNEVAAPAPNGSAGCVCTDNAPYCAFGTSDAHDYIVTGTGGPIPLTGSGGGGTWPNVLPPNALMRQIVLPTDATSIDWVSFKALSHTYVGDLQFVLYGPSGVGHNLAHRPGFTGTGFGLSTDLAGDYTIIGADAPAPWPTTVPLVLPPQSYNQYFGNWPSGVNNIFNTPMNAIPVVPGGIYTLAVFDWAGGDMGNLATWNVAGHGPPGPAVYCSAGTTTNMCFASISASHQPSVSFANACMIATVNVEGQKNGITFYGLASNITPWGPGSTSFLCVKPPTQRTGGQTSGGTNGLCDGMFVLDWNAYQIANPTALGNPWNVGSKAYLQSWFRDPPAVKTTNLSNAVEITYLP